MKSFAHFGIVALLFSGASILPGQQAPPPASLIYAGWFGNTIPTPAFVRDNRVFLETQPFDGLVVYLRDPGLTSNVTTTVMTTTPVSYATASWVMAPIAGLPFSHLANNLGLIQGSTPPDFFDDWSVTTQNFANVAKAAKDAGLKGLCFDNEQYFAPWGDYPAGVSHPGHTLAEYQVQARLRGKQVMQAMVAEFPAIAVLTLHGPYVSEPAAPWQLGFPQWQSGNELLGPFFAGFMEGVGTTAASIDGGELYTLRTPAQFLASYSWRRNDIASAAVNCAYIPPALRPLWPGLSSISFGVYDCPFGGADMNPAILQSTLTNALMKADRYVWFYAEASTYLLPSGSGGAAAPWVNAIRQAKIDAGAGSGPTIPAAPSTLHASGVTAASVTLAWTDGSSNENGFSIERLNGAAWAQIGTVAADVTTYPDINLGPATLYRYRVLAFNGAGNSPTTNELAVTTLPASGPQVPAAPSSLVGSALSSSVVSLAWTDASSNENGFSIERLIGSSWTQVGTVPDNVTTYPDINLSPSTLYRYRVLAFNGAGNSPTTNEVAVTTLPVAPQVPIAPTQLTGSAISSSQVALAWTDTSSNENGFSIERQLGAAWVQVGTVAANVTTYQDGGLSPHTTYRYRVLAFNAAGNSAPTNEVRVRTRR